MKMKSKKNSGFSLIELLAVTAIIAIISGMIGVAAHNARQRSYMTIARTEAQQIATAFKSYWVAKGEWPKGDFSAAEGVELSKGVLDTSGLLRDDKVGVAYLEISADRLEIGPAGAERFFCDPWGHPYRVKLEPVKPTEETVKYQGVVRFINSDAYYYQEM